MPKSKRSAKRREKLKKRGNNRYNWAVRKVMTLSQEDVEKFIAESDAKAKELQDGESNDMQG